MTMGTGRRLLPIAVLLLAAVLRFWQLGRVPPGFQFDEAHNAIDAARVLAGQPAIFFPDNGGREPLLVYLQAPWIALLGRDHTVLAIRLTSAFLGILAVAVLYRFVADTFRDEWLALLAAAFLAVSYWHLHFSRYAIRAILAPLWTTLAIWAWWAALRPGHPGGDTVGASQPRNVWAASAAGCGVFMALAVYSHPTGRLIPLILLGHAAFRALVNRPAGGRAWRALAVAGVTAAVLCMPLGGFFWQHPELFAAHPSDVSLVAVAQAQFDGSVPWALSHHFGAVAGMFFLAGDPSTFHNLPGLPVFDPVSALLAVIGVGVGLGALLARATVRQDRAVLLALWLGVMLLPTVLSDRPPNYSRAIAALPVIILLPAVGLRWLLSQLPGRRRTKVLVATAVIAWAGLWTAWQHFHVFARLPQVYYSYDVDKLDAYRALVKLSGDFDVFLAPVWAEHATVAVLNTGGPVRTLDSRDTVVFPANGRGEGRSVLLAMPAKEAEREGWEDSVASWLCDSVTRAEIDDAHGRPLLVTFQISRSLWGPQLRPGCPAAPLGPLVPTDARFGQGLDLLAVRLGAAHPGQELPIVFEWSPTDRIGADLTTFVHLVGPNGEPLGQQDREPGWGSYRTSTWQPGDLIVDRFTPVLDPSAVGPVVVEVGWYDPAGGERLPVGDGTSLRLGPIEVER